MITKEITVIGGGKIDVMHGSIHQRSPVTTIDWISKMVLQLTKNVCNVYSKQH